MRITLQRTTLCGLAVALGALSAAAVPAGEPARQAVGQRRGGIGGVGGMGRPNLQAGINPSLRFANQVQNQGVWRAGYYYPMNNPGLAYPYRPYYPYYSPFPGSYFYSLPPYYRYAMLRDQAYFIFNNAYHVPQYYMNQVVYVPVPVPQGAPEDPNNLGEAHGDARNAGPVKPKGQFQQDAKSNAKGQKPKTPPPPEQP